MSNQTNARFSALQRLLSLLFVFTLFLGLLPAGEAFAADKQFHRSHGAHDQHSDPQFVIHYALNDQAGNLNRWLSMPVAKPLNPHHHHNRNPIPQRIHRQVERVEMAPWDKQPMALVEQGEPRAYGKRRQNTLPPTLCTRGAGT